jgi:hypothetical protein
MPPNWITLPQRTNNLSIETEFSITKRIYGSSGGELKLDKKYSTTNGSFHILATLKFEKNSFSDYADITMTVDDVNGTVTYSPSMNFLKPATLNLKFEGLDLTGIHPDSLDFVYYSPYGSQGSIVYQEIRTGMATGLLELRNGKIPHFSRYGFSR